MNKDDSRWNDTRVTPSSGNVFIDLGFDTAEAEIMLLRAEVMIRIEQRLESKVTLALGLKITVSAV